MGPLKQLHLILGIVIAFSTRGLSVGECPNKNRTVTSKLRKCTLINNDCLTNLPIIFV